MPKRNQIRTLCEHALSQLARTIVQAIGDGSFVFAGELAVVMVQINDYLENAGATSDIYQDLLKVILGSDTLDASIRFTCLQMLLNGSVQYLVTEIFPFSYYEKILQVIAAQGHGLRFLNLKGVWVKEELMFYLYEIVAKLRHLEHLSIPYIANDELLEHIARQCPNLRMLDIAGETDITEIGMESLALGVCKDTLTVVDIGMLREENICHTDIALLLMNCPNIVTFQTYSYVGRTVQYIYRQDPEFKCKLKYIHDTETTDKTLDAIVSCCPNLENLYMDTSDAGILKKLRHLKHLERLKLYKFSCKELDSVLMNGLGGRLRFLTLIKGRGTMDLGKLASICPAIVDLDCYLMEHLIYASDHTFESLEGLEILNSTIVLSSLKHFVAKHTTLKRLAIDTVHFTDEDMMSTVEILLERCPELQSLGQLSGWALTPDDLSLLRGILKSSNSSLVLSPSSIFP
uniref:Putative f-box protein n=1 Tax=Lutzomyia longipalpis TaxID=7200 RepID=A0A1B0GK90_LUTLO